MGTCNSVRITRIHVLNRQFQNPIRNYEYTDPDVYIFPVTMSFMFQMISKLYFFYYLNICLMSTRNNWEEIYYMYLVSRNFTIFVSLILLCVILHGFLYYIKHLTVTIFTINNLTQFYALKTLNMFPLPNQSEKLTAVRNNYTMIEMRNELLSIFNWS